ncbi:MAG: hypothetical protein AAB425_01040, partial [Bdellovibrionota bacterium]
FFALPPHAANAEEIRDSIPKRQRECLTLLYDAFTRLESSEWESLAKGVEITLGYEIENSDLKAVSKLYQPSYRAILSLLDMVDDREFGFLRLYLDTKARTGDRAFFARHFETDLAAEAKDYFFTKAYELRFSPKYRAFFAQWRLRPEYEDLYLSRRLKAEVLPHVYEVTTDLPTDFTYTELKNQIEATAGILGEIPQHWHAIFPGPSSLEERTDLQYFAAEQSIRIFMDRYTIAQSAGTLGPLTDSQTGTYLTGGIHHVSYPWGPNARGCARYKTTGLHDDRHSIEIRGYSPEYVAGFERVIRALRTGSAKPVLPGRFHEEAAKMMEGLIFETSPFNTQHRRLARTAKQWGPPNRDRGVVHNAFFPLLPWPIAFPRHAARLERAATEYRLALAKVRTVSDLGAAYRAWLHATDLDLLIKLSARKPKEAR